MRIAVSASDPQGLKSMVHPHFGRCPYFVIVDVEDSEIKETSSVANPFYPNHEPGQVPAFIHQQGAEVMLTGGMGFRALSFFQQSQIRPVTGAQGTVAEAVAQFLNGELSEADACSESKEHGHGH